MLFGESLRHKAIVLLPAALAIVITVKPAPAQVLYGTLVGTIEDASRAVVPNAVVTASGEATGQSRQTTTDSEGRYQLTNLPQGLYTITVTAPGFRTYRQTGIEVTINTVARADVQLDVGQVSESIAVTGSATLLQTEKADVHVDIGSKEVAELPLPMYRNYQSLINLVPGATPARTQNATIGSPGRALATNVNGTAHNNNNNRLDGANNVRAHLPHQAHYIPPAESIETVNVSTNSFDAEQGFAGGVAVNVITKSGTNNLHGSLFEYHTNSHLRAKDFFYTAEKKPKNILNMYGGTIGGPIIKNKLFYFGSFEGLRERQNESRLLIVPTADQRIGNFSAFGVTIYDPLTGAADGSGRTPFPNATVPADRQSAITRKMQDLIPMPNLPGTANNYFASKPVIFDRDNYDVKINWMLSPKTTVWGKYSAMSSDVQGFPALDDAGGPGFPWGAGTGDILGQLATLAATHVFSSAVVMDVTLGFARMAVQDLGFDYGKNFGLETLGIPGTNGPDPRQGGIPFFSVSGYTSLGQVDAWMPKILFDNTWTFASNVGWHKGSHDMRFGVDIARDQQHHWHPEQGDNGPRGRFRFEGGVTALRNGPAPNQFNHWAAFLLGMPQRVGKALQFFDPMAPRESRFGFYFRDRWQATRNLTLTLGLRWEYFPLLTYAHNGAVRYDWEVNKVFIGGLGSVPDSTGIEISKRDFGPRIGLAYRLGQDTVIRSGYGISVDPVPMGAFLLDPYPAVINQDFAGANSFLPVSRIEQGIPPIPTPDISSGIIDMPLAVTTKTLDKGSYNRGYIQSFNFVIERQLPWAMVASAGYVATRTIGQLGNLNINAAPISGGQNGRPLARQFGRNVDTSLYRNFLGSRYDSLQARLDRRFSNGLLIKTSYTWGKAINETDGSYGGLAWNHPEQMHRNRALAGYDRTHNLRIASLAELPFGRGKPWANTNRMARVLLGGWQLNGIFSAYSGTPFTVSASGTSLDAPGNTQTADQVKTEVQKLGGVGPGTPFFDPTAFAPVREARYGTSGRNILRGPGVVHLDASLFRSFRFSERWNLQFRAESFNLTNTPHFANPSANVDTPGSFMIISSTVGTDANLEGPSRGFRFGLRLSF